MRPRSVSTPERLLNLCRRSARVEDARVEASAGEKLRDPPAACNGRKKADAVAAEVVEESLVLAMNAYDAELALVVAHEPVPVVLVRTTGRPDRVGVRSYLVVDHLQQRTGERRI